MFQEKKAWKHADTECKNITAHLVKIESEEENDFLLDNYLNLPEDQLNIEAWIGLNDREEEGKFVWADNSEANYTNWADEQPNDEHEQDCGEIANGQFWPGGEQQVGVWNDFQCETEMMYICEKPWSSHVETLSNRELISKPITNQATLIQTQRANLILHTVHILN